ncbi:protein rhiB [Xanthomonas campestris]|nr:protein rhiB [Xanthomonas campestris]
MRGGIPIGGVCLYVGEVAYASDAANPAWPKPKEFGFTRAQQAAAGVGAMALLEVEGWMVCDGRALEIAKYRHLYAVLGTIHGDGGQEGMFQLPDLRGVFVRGVDHGSGADPDLPKRLQANGQGAYSGVGSIQLDALHTHKHTYARPEAAVTSNQTGNAYSVSDKDEMTSGPEPEDIVSDNETRPRNVAAYYIIRYA